MAVYVFLLLLYSTSGRLFILLFPFSWFYPPSWNFIQCYLFCDNQPKPSSILHPHWHFRFIVCFWRWTFLDCASLLETYLLTFPLSPFRIHDVAKSRLSPRYRPKPPSCFCWRRQRQGGSSIHFVTEATGLSFVCFVVINFVCYQPTELIWAFLFHTTP